MATYVLIPGAGGAAWYWHRVVPELGARGQNAERIGLPSLSMDDMEAQFGHDVPAEVWAAGAEHQRDQSGTPFGEPWPLDAWPDVPIRVLLSRDDRLFPADFQRRVAQERLGIVPDEMDGGHLVALSRPGELAERLDAYR